MSLKSRLQTHPNSLLLNIVQYSLLSIGVIGLVFLIGFYVGWSWKPSLIVSHDVPAARLVFNNRTYGEVDTNYVAYAVRGMSTVLIYDKVTKTVLEVSIPNGR